MTAQRSSFPCPMVKRGFEPYRSPINSDLIVNNKEKERDHLRTETMPYQDVKVKDRHNLKKGEGDAG